MGATGWSYFVPYEADISVALQRLRKDVFARGDYIYGDGVTDDQRKAILEKARPELNPWMQKVREEAAKLQEPFKTKYLEMAERIKSEITGDSSTSQKPKQKPKTIEEVLEFQAENGTHSILDVVGISQEPKFGCIRPFPHEKLVEFFGSETPSHAEIEEAHDFGLLKDFVSERWEGIYVIAYLNGSASEIFFAGCSGD
ncbi:MAG TPA: hypothetical protein VFY06_13245 [Verrucomicrobiae bacterium]|nr:hypothetical protein [Verrucomicrobiae bacterium]